MATTGSFTTAGNTDVLQVLIALNAKPAIKAVQQLENKLRTLNRTLMAIGMGVMFTGMAIQRFFRNILRGLIGTFMAVEGEQSGIVNLFHGLQAAWEFLKYDLFQSFVKSGAAEILIDQLKRMVEGFTGLGEKTKVAIVAGSIGAFIVGGFMVAIGFTINQIVILGKNIELILALAKKKAVVAWLDSWALRIQAVKLKIAALVTAIKGITLKTFLIKFGIALAIFSAIIFLYHFMDNTREELELSWGGMFVAIARGWAQVILDFLSFLQGSFETGFQRVWNIASRWLDPIIEKINRATGANIGKLGTVATTGSFTMDMYDNIKRYQTAADGVLDSIFGERVQVDDGWKLAIDSAKHAVNKLSMGTLFSGVEGIEQQAPQAPVVNNYNNVTIDGNLVTMSELEKIWLENLNSNFPAGSAGQ